ncbi:uncharacterized protein LOC131685447 isoform X2 [Topomyia yanbarensis]|nr:uncharacterized protein LOC131685447 isoform X2 [Topomyia yanbarensis]
MLFIGTLEIHEVEVALKYGIGLGIGGLPLDVYRRRPIEGISSTVAEIYSELDVEFMYTMDATIDLTRLSDEPGNRTSRNRRRRLRRRQLNKVNAKRRRERIASAILAEIDNELSDVDCVYDIDEATVDLTGPADKIGTTSRRRRRRFQKRKLEQANNVQDAKRYRNDGLNDVEFMYDVNDTIDLTRLANEVGMMPDCRMEGGSSPVINGIEFCINMIENEFNEYNNNIERQLVKLSSSFIDVPDIRYNQDMEYDMNATIDLTRHTEEAGTTNFYQREDESTKSGMELWTDTMENEFDENDDDVIFIDTNYVKHSSSVGDEQERRSAQHITNHRIGIFCPRPYRSRLMNRIMSAMDSIPAWKPYPQYKRNGYSLDTMWFLAANEFSASWMIDTVAAIAKEPNWRAVSLLVEPWNNNFVVKNVIELTLPWKRYPGNRKAKVVQRLRKANVVYGSNHWNLIGCKLEKFKIRVRLAVNEETMLSLKKTQFYVFYGFSQYRCQVIKATTK